MTDRLNLKTLLLFAVCGALAACATGRPSNTPLPPRDPFSAALYDQYRQLAVDSDARHDDMAAKHFTRKAHKVANGETTMPDSPHLNGLTIAQQHRAGDAYRRLARLLKSDTKRLFPEALAQAQGRYDCWLTEMKENPHSHGAYICAAQFEQAIAPLEQHRLAVQGHAGLTLLPAVNSYKIYFDSGKPELSTNDAATLDEVAQETTRAHPAAIILTNYTTAATRIDRKLAARRNEAVMQALRSRGISVPITSVSKPTPISDAAEKESQSIHISFR